jgi:hypothetical protein
MMFVEKHPIRDLLASRQAGADAPDDALAERDGAASTPDGLAFEADDADDAGTAWRQFRSASDRFDLIRAFAGVLRVHSGELLDRSQTLKARSTTLRKRAEPLGEQDAEALRARNAGPLGEPNAGVLAEPNAGALGERNAGALGERNAGALGERNAGECGHDGGVTGVPFAAESPFITESLLAGESAVLPWPNVGAGPEAAEIPLLGGDMTRGVVRVGGTVRRPVRPHTPAVHALLRHLEAVGFEGAPRVLGVDARNREVLTYLPGVVARRPRAAFVTADSTLVSLAGLLLRYHEAVAGFEPPAWARWDGELTRLVDGPPGIVCHCDVNLENVIFRPGPDGPRPYALIDFDLARPGTRLVDIIQTLRHWAPIAEPADRDPALKNADAPARIAVFCEAYGLPCAERARLVSVASRWLRRSRDTIAQRARIQGGAWIGMLEAGVGERLLRSAVWLERHRPEIEARLRRPDRRPW